MNSFVVTVVGKSVGLLLIVTYHWDINDLNKLIHKILKHVQDNQTVKMVFTIAHFVSFSITRNFQSHFVRSNL